MNREKAKWLRRWKRHRRTRKRIHGTAERPRLSIYRGLKNIYCQLIDDDESKTLIAVSTLSPEARGEADYGGNANAARALGKMLAEKALGHGIKRVVLDRGGCKYHGRIAALADGAREVGLKV